MVLHKDLRRTIINADFKDRLCVVYTSFIHNIMAVKTQMSSTLPTCWMHEAFTVQLCRLV